MSHRTKEIVRLAAPIVIGQVSHILVGLADTWMVGKTGQTPLAALASAAPVFLVGFLVFSALFQGTQTLCARRLGEERLMETGTVLHSALLIGLCVGIPASLLGIFLPELIMPSLTPDAETAEIAADYLQYRWGGGMGLIVIAFVFRGFYWGIGLTRADLFVSLLFNATNVFLNWVFIYGRLGAEPMGAAGAGLASSLANLLSVIVFVLLSLRHGMRERYGTFRRPPQRAVAAQVMRLSLPRSVQALAFGHSIIFFKIVGDCSDQAGLAVSGVIWRVIGFSVLVSLGIGNATATIVGRELGRGNHDEAARYGWSAAWLGMGTVAVITAVLAVFARPILTGFLAVSPSLGTSNLSADVLATMALTPFLLMLGFQVIDACGIILARALNGAGEVVYVMYAEIAVAWLICIPATLLGTHLMRDSDPLLGAWWGWAAYCASWALAMVWRWRQGRWRDIVI